MVVPGKEAALPLFALAPPIILPFPATLNSDCSRKGRTLTCQSVGFCFRMNKKQARECGSASQSLNVDL